MSSDNNQTGSSYSTVKFVVRQAVLLPTESVACASIR
jgi:hypothetical protein